MTFFVIRSRNPGKALRTVIYAYAGKQGRKKAKAHAGSWSMARDVATRVVDAEDFAALLDENPELFEEVSA